MTDAGRLDAATAGYIVALDLMAQVVGTLLFMTQRQRVPWAACYGIGLGLMVAGNVLSCVAAGTSYLIAARLVAGVGAGVLRSAYFVLLARARDPARAVAVLVMVQILSTSAAFATLPAAIHAYGWFGPYLLFSAVGLVMFTTVPWWPRQLSAERTARDSVAIKGSAMMALGATFINFAALEGVWGFMEAIGLHAGESVGAISTALAFVAVPGVAAMLLVPVVSARLSVARALIAGLGLTLVGLYALTLNSRSLPFGIAVGFFYFVWNATVPFQFAAVVASDKRGTAAAAFPAADGLGIAAGPALAGFVVTRAGTPALLGWAAAFAVVSILLFVGAGQVGKTRREHRGANT